MQSEETQSFYEKRLLQEIEQVEARIRELEAERVSLRRLLANARGRDRVAKDVKRKNSIDRILVERTVIDALSDTTSKTTKHLFQRMQEIIYSINENTFRSHLHRMKTKGMIENYRNRRGIWCLPESREESGQPTTIKEGPEH